MRKSGEKSPKFGGIDPQTLVRGWRRLHPQKSTLCVAERLDAPVRTVEKWFDGSSVPSFEYFGRILRAYGPVFLCSVMPDPPEWLRNAAHLAECDALDAEIAALQMRRAAVADSLSAP